MPGELAVTVVVRISSLVIIVVAIPIIVPSLVCSRECTTMTRRVIIKTVITKNLQLKSRIIQQAMFMQIKLSLVVGIFPSSCFLGAGVGL